MHDICGVNEQQASAFIDIQHLRKEFTNSWISRNCSMHKRKTVHTKQKVMSVVHWYQAQATITTTTTKYIL